MPPSPITRSEREDLLRVARLNHRVSKAEIERVAARRYAEFEEQLATIYSFDKNEIWREAVEAGRAAVELAAERIKVECERLGIPSWAQPTLNSPWWSGRGQNAVAERRIEMRRAAKVRLEAMKKEAVAGLEAWSAQIQTKLLSIGFGEEAKALLESMPGPEQLLPTLSITEIEQGLLSDHR